MSDERKMIEGAGLGHELRPLIASTCADEQEWVEFCAGLLGVIAAALSRHVGVESTNQLLDNIKAAVTQECQTPATGKH